MVQSRFRKSISTLLLLSLIFPSIALAKVSLDNLQVNSNTLSSKNTNGNIVLDPNGTGAVNFVDLTASRVPYLNASKNFVTSSVTDVELGYLSGVVSSVQTQLNAARPMTNAGDIIYGSTSGVPARLANGTAGQFLRSSGTTLAPAWANLPTPTVQLFLSGSGTYTTPANVRYIIVTVQGPGGGGAGSSGSTGSGGNGGTGTSATFGTSLITATSGTGGIFANSEPGAGGLCTINGPAVTIQNTTGTAGFGGVALPSTTGNGGAGGTGMFGGGGAGARNGGQAGGTPPANSGAGGGGASTANAAGFAGSGGAAGGGCIALIAAPSASYSYSLGTIGAGGTAGTGVNGFAGGPGALGKIRVEEHY